ncbi:GH25 family lysozyme [Weissella bombi]|uniref:Glycosyl hydrolases family 25 n=2 Tax=Weissella bombi TaxID=1505725 RepID=A0A1C4C3T3_9LACO|nr:GH25 family lysozyme [Weissella bombi]SCC13786.1 Glycosyl hydrolases family 25 [Weissella bombi]
MTLNGIDISNWQPNINLSIVPGDFVIVKVTQGVDYISPVADKQYQQAKKSGKLLGVYHFADGSGAKQEAQYYLDNIKGYIGEALLALDWEGDVVVKGVSYAKTWLDYVYKQTNIRPVIYMSKSVTNLYDWSTVAKDYGLWCAQYADKSPTGYQDTPWTDTTPFGSWSAPTIYQYSSTGNLSGYGGDLDLDKFYGTKGSWLSFTKGEQSSSSNEGSNTPVTPVQTKIPIVQYSDNDGNRAYAYTHWDAVNGKPAILSKEDLQPYALKNDLPPKIALTKGTINLKYGLPALNYAYNDKLVTVTFIGSVEKTIQNMQGDTQIGSLSNDVPKPPFDVTASLIDISNLSNMGHLKIQPNGGLVVNMTNAWNGDWISGTVSYAI